MLMDTAVRKRCVTPPPKARCKMPRADPDWQLLILDQRLANHIHRAEMRIASLQPSPVMLKAHSCTKKDWDNHVLGFKYIWNTSDGCESFEHAVWHERVNEHVRLTVEKFGVPLEHLQTCLVEF